MPTWLGELAFGLFFTPKSENDKIARQLRSAAGLAVFVGQADDKAHWVQVGRCYDKKGTKSDLLGYFEPWNQQRFDPSEPSISRVQWRQAYKSYRANEDHFQHNVGV